MHAERDAKLYRHAVTALGLAPIDAEVAGRFEAMELVDMMFEHGLAGELPFDLRRDATEKQVGPLPEEEAPLDVGDLSSARTPGPPATTRRSTRSPT